ncbi:MAG: DUF2062 domain-containing protein, partial [Rhodospirillales bacterium]|nr:DUF2062 domain-containing protein [Rhodospirillales bacterium]
VGNPWTFPLIWPGIFYLGKAMGVGAAEVVPETLAFTMLFGNIIEALLSFDIMFLVKKAWPIIFPMLIGGIPAAVAVWFIFYLATRPLIQKYQERRIRRCQAKTEDASR